MTRTDYSFTDLENLVEIEIAGVVIPFPKGTNHLAYHEGDEQLVIYPSQKQGQNHVRGHGEYKLPAKYKGEFDEKLKELPDIKEVPSPPIPRI